MEENIGQTSPAVPVVPSETEKQSTKPWFKIVGLSVLGLLLAGGLVFAGMQIGKRQAIPALPAGRRDTQYAIRISPIPAPLISPILTFPPETTFSPLPSEAPAKEGDETVGWKSYTNIDYKFSFRYPTDFTYWINNQKNFIQVVVNEKKPNSFIVKAEKGYSLGNVIYFLDTPSSGQRDIDGNIWKIYYLPQGYGSGPEGSAGPIFALQIEKDDILYSISFNNQTDTTQLQNQILSTFKFLD